MHLDIKPENIIISNGTKDDYDIEIDDYLYNKYINPINPKPFEKYIKLKFIDFGKNQKIQTFIYNGKEIKIVLSKNKFNMDYYLPEKMPTVKILSESKKKLYNYKGYKWELDRFRYYMYSIYMDFYAIGKINFRFANPTIRNIDNLNFIINKSSTQNENGKYYAKIINLFS